MSFGGLFTTIIGAAVGALVGSGTSWLFNAGTRRRLRDLEDVRIRRIEGVIEKHVSSDESGKVGGQMAGVIKRLDEISGKVSGVREDFREVKADTGRNTESLHEAHKRIDQHVERFHTRHPMGGQ